MKKMPCLFVRNFVDNVPTITNEVTPGCEWVLAGEGIATRKFDGTSCMIEDGVLYKRYDCKKGKVPPVDFKPCQPEPDEITGHWPGWVNLTVHDKYHIEAFAVGDFENGTYELCGPKVQGNPEGFETHVLVKHGSVVIENCPRTFEGLKVLLTNNFGHEGIVFHRENGDMCKIRVSDFM